mgnify:CR=1 FL=1
MVTGLENLAQMEYPGRFIIMSKRDGDVGTVIYGITGRSLSSQARKMIKEPGSVIVTSTDDKAISTGNTDLLLYTAMYSGIGGIAVSNGKQTDSIFGGIEKGREDYRNTTQNLLSALDPEWTYEPDQPNFTPRISGLMNSINNFSLNIIKRAKNEKAVRFYYQFDVNANEGKLIATYTGKNENPLPSFIGEPLDVKITGKKTKDIAEQVWENLNPEYRVSVACICREEYMIPHIINKHQ